MADVKVILREAGGRLGEAGDLVSVKPGHAKNYLIPQGKAILATDSRVKELEHHKRVITEQVAREMKDLELVRDRLQKLKLEVAAQAGEEGKLFGSVTTLQIAELIAEKGYEIDRRKISLSEPIKEVGDHVVPVRLQRGVIAEVKVRVTAAE